MGNEAFSECEKLTDENGFVLFQNIIFNYYGNEENIVIPERTTVIEKNAFEGCENIRNVTFPESVTEIRCGAFSGCKYLQSIFIPEGVTEIGCSSFVSCTSIKYIVLNNEQFDNFTASGISVALIIKSKEGVSLFAYSSKACSSNKTDFVDRENWNTYDLDLINNGPTYKYKLPARLLGALGRLNDPVDLTDECKELYVELLVKNAKKLIPIAEEIDCPEIIEMMIKHEIINDGNRKAINKLLKASANEKIAAFAE